MNKKNSTDKQRKTFHKTVTEGQTDKRTELKNQKMQEKNMNKHFKGFWFTIEGRELNANADIWTK